MATTDKHPPLDPRRHSTNKKIKAKPYKPFGTAVKVAEGAKRVKVGDKNTTSAKTDKAGETELQRRKRLEGEAMSKRLWEEEAKKDKVRKKVFKDGASKLELEIIRKHSSFKKSLV